MSEISNSYIVCPSSHSCCLGLSCCPPGTCCYSNEGGAYGTCYTPSYDVCTQELDGECQVVPISTECPPENTVCGSTCCPPGYVCAYNPFDGCYCGLDSV